MDFKSKNYTVTEGGKVRRYVKITVPETTIDAGVSCLEEGFDWDKNQEMEKRMIQELSIKILYVAYSQIYKDDVEKIQEAYKIFEDTIKNPNKEYDLVEWESVSGQINSRIVSK